jgi:hypothetical protein
MSEELPVGALSEDECKHLSDLSYARLKKDGLELKKTYYMVYHYGGNRGEMVSGPLWHFGFDARERIYYFDKFWLAWACSMKLKENKAP